MNATQPESTVALPPVSAVFCALRDLIDPEVGVNVVDLGMVGDVGVSSDGRVVIDLMPTMPGCPMHDVLAEGATQIVRSMPGVQSVEVRFVYEPPWTPDRIAPEVRTQLGMR